MAYTRWHSLSFLVVLRDQILQLVQENPNQNLKQIKVKLNSFHGVKIHI